MTPSQELVAAAIRPVDEAAARLERKWGVARLPSLVAPEFGRAFLSQAAKLNAALAVGAVDTVEVEARKMLTAWTTLDQLATEAGHKPIEPLVWEVVDPETGVLVARLVRTTPEQHAVAREMGPSIPVWSMEEVARVITGFPDLLKLKTAFPEAVIESARPKINWSRGDELPESLSVMASG